MVFLKGSPASDAGEDELIIVSSQEVSDALDRLKPGKAMDKDSIAGEHVIYAKEVLVEIVILNTCTNTFLYTPILEHLLKLCLWSVPAVYTALADRSSATNLLV